MPVRHATIADLDAVVPLFDAYRVFYNQSPDPAGARAFLFERFVHQQSTIFIAQDGSGAAIGFAQIFPLFSSAAMQRILLLNDLFVSPQGRKAGIGTALIEACADHGRRTGAVRLMLRTAIDNVTAQSVYEAHGWVRDEAFYTYNLAL